MQEDRAFINGIILGVLVVSFLVGTAILLALGPTQASQRLPLPSSWAVLPSNQAQIAQAQVTKPAQTVAVQGQIYKIIASASDASTTFSVLKLASLAQEPSCFNQDNKDLIFATWQGNSELPATFDRQTPSQMDTSGCTDLIGWQAERGVLFSHTTTDALNAQQSLVLYDPAHGGFQTEVAYSVVRKGNSVYQLWSSPVARFVQQLGVKGQAGDLYHLPPGNDFDPAMLSTAPVILVADAELFSDLRSDANVQACLIGLYLSKEGQSDTTFIPWRS